MKEQGLSPEEWRDMLQHVSRDSVLQLDEYVPIEIQTHYMLASAVSRAFSGEKEKISIEELQENLGEFVRKELAEGSDEKANESTLQELLLRVARSGSVELLDFITKLLLPTLPQGRVRYWVLMAQLELRLHILGNLSDEHPVLIATALGGKGHLIRYHGALISSTLLPWEGYQIHWLEEEFVSLIQEYEGEVEDTRSGENYFRFSILLPYDADARQLIRELYERSLEFGGFVHERCAVTNASPIDDTFVSEQIEFIRSKKHLHQSNTDTPPGDQEN